MRRRWISFFCVLLLFAGGCSVGEDGEAALSHTEETAATESEAPKETVQLAVAVSSDWTEVLRGGIFENAAGKLEEWSDGTLSIRLYDRGQLGDDADLIQGVQLWTLNVINSVPASQIAAVPEAALLDAPGIFSSVEQYNWMMESGYLDVMQGYYQQAGLKLLDSYAVSFRQLSSSQDLTDPETLQGLPVRVIENEYHETFWRSLGAEPVPYAFEELRFCLQEGIAQAQENPVGTMLEEELMDVQSTLTLTNHMPMIYVLAMNRERFEELSREQQDQLTAFGESLQADMIRRLPELEQQNLETLQNDYGISVQEPSPAWEGRIRQGQQAVLELLRSNLGNEKVDQMLQAAAAAGADLGQ